ncbi:MAG: phosphatase PAP2 family protein [Chthoniobacterales bacterium]
MGDSGAARRFDRQIRFLQARLSPEGYLGLHLTVGMVLIILTCWGFSEIAEDFSRAGWLAAMDERALLFSHQHATPALTQMMRAVTFLGSVGFVSAVALCIAVVLAVRRSFYNFLTFVLTMMGGSCLNIFLKHLFHRQRPILEDPLVTLTSYGFPSGHTMGTTMLCGCLAIFAASAIRTRQAGLWPFVLATVWTAIIGASRIYLGAHYFTDVIGACCAGVAWLTFCWTAVETLRRWRERHALRSARQEASS